MTISILAKSFEYYKVQCIYFVSIHKVEASKMVVLMFIETFFQSCQTLNCILSCICMLGHKEYCIAYQNSMCTVRVLQGLLTLERNVPVH